MSEDRKHFFLKLHPPRATFSLDMSAEERTIMQNHVAYWAPYVSDGTMIVMGPVMDPNGVYGVGIIGVGSEEELRQLLAHDPANGLNRYEVHPMRAVSRQVR